METYDSDDESVESYKTDVENPLINDFPYELMYGVHPRELEDCIDVDMLHYNDSFKRQGAEFIKSKLPAGSYDHIPGFQEVIDLMAENISDSPLDELNSLKTLKKQSEDNLYDDRKDSIVLIEQDREQEDE